MWYVLLQKLPKVNRELAQRLMEHEAEHGRVKNMLSYLKSYRYCEAKKMPLDFIMVFTLSSFIVCHSDKGC